METIQQFIAEYSLKLEAIPIHNNPNMSDMPAKSRHFWCTITGAGGGVMAVPFSVGPGVVESWARKQTAFKRAARGLNPKTVSYQGEVEHIAPKYRPELEDILSCLASDASLVHNARYYEEWASESGYDEDSRKGEATYKVCQKQAAELEDMLGHDAFEKLLYETERRRNWAWPL